MKKYVIIMMVLSCGLFFSACNDWLEPKIENEITADKMYQSGDGYRAVLNGLYKAMGKPSLYGRELSFGFLDCLSQQYRLDEKTIPTYCSAADFQYRDNDVKGIVDGIWLAAYNVIASANDLIQHGESASVDMFENGKEERDMIVGEAYACRALMHFEMLRLFAPAPTEEELAKKINVPYVENFPNVQPEANLTMKEFLQKCVKDLEKGQQLVAATDTIQEGISRISSVDERFYSSEGSLYSGRGYHLNYYAINALLARICQYAGEHDKAASLAKNICEWGGEWTPYFDDSQFWMLEGVTDWNKKDGLRLPYGLIFAVNNKDIFEEAEIATYFPVENRGGAGEDEGSGEIVNNQLLVVNRDEIFNHPVFGDESLMDYRSTLLIYQVGGTIPVSGKWYASTDADIRAKNLAQLPVLRVSEMYYIQAETYARNGDYASAAQIFNTMRSNRGMWESMVDIKSWDDFVRELVADARREWISEGQLFYLYKRLGNKVKLMTGEERALKREEVTLPVPENQRI